LWPEEASGDDDRDETPPVSNIVIVVQVGVAEGTITGLVRTIFSLFEVLYASLSLPVINNQMITE